MRLDIGNTIKGKRPGTCPIGSQSLLGETQRQLQVCKKYVEKGRYKISGKITVSHQFCLTVKKDSTDGIIFESDGK